jgi:hypothetical protein
MPFEDGDVRISDAEREAAASSLGRHLASGRLDLTEYEERIEKAYQAKRSHQLDALFVDLPPEARPPAVRVRRVRWFPLPLVPVIALLVGLTVVTGRPVILALWWLVPIALFRLSRRRLWSGS